MLRQVNEKKRQNITKNRIVNLTKAIYININIIKYYTLVIIIKEDLKICKNTVHCSDSFNKKNSKRSV